MSIVRVGIEPIVIKDAIYKSGRSLDEVKNRFNNIEKWLNNELKPTYHQLVDLSKYLRIPFGYLLINAPIDEEIPLLEFRTIDTENIQNPSRELIDTINDMEYKQAWLREALIEDGREPLPYVGMIENNEDLNFLEVAGKIRDIFFLDKNWYEKTNNNTSTFTLLREIFSRSGIIIMQNGTALNNTHRALELNEFRAFTLVDEYAPLIFINSLDSNSGKTFSLLHEVAHILFGINSLYNDDFKKRNKYNSTIEVICNKIAGEIIAPTDVFINFWKDTYKYVHDYIEKIAMLASDFKVSKLIIARKALDQNFIDQNQYYEIRNIVQEEFRLFKQKRKEQVGGNPVITHFLD